MTAKNFTPSEARENAGGQIPISFSLKYNLPRKWPITSSEVKKTKAMQGTFDTQLKIAYFLNCMNCVIVCDDSFTYIFISPFRDIDIM